MPDKDLPINKSQIILANTFDSNALISAVKEYVLSKNIKLSAVGTFRENAVIPTADLAEYFNLPGIGSEPARRSSQNKVLMRSYLQEKGFKKQPKFALVNIYDKNIIDIIKDFPKPCVIKPTFGTASYGVRMIVDNNNIKNSIEDAKQSMTPKDRSVFKLFQGDMLIEEYVSGRLFSVDGFIQNKTVVIAGMMEFIMGEEPYFTQISSFTPPKISNNLRGKCYNLAKEVIKILGFQNGGFHCEMRVSTKGPVLIEIAARLPGADIYKTYKEIYELDINKTLFDIWLGIPIKVKPKVGYFNFHKHVHANINKDSVLEKINMPSQNKQIPEMWYLKQYAHDGQIIKTYPKVPDILYGYAVKSRKYSELKKLAKKVEDSVNYRFKI